MTKSPTFAAVFVAGVLASSTGCVRWTHLAPSGLQIHGKAGQACSAVATPLVWTVNTVFFPVSVASLGQKPPSHDNLGYPGLAVENTAYFACATLGLPLYGLGCGDRTAFFSPREPGGDRGSLDRASPAPLPRRLRTPRADSWTHQPAPVRTRVGAEPAACPGSCRSPGIRALEHRAGAALREQAAPREPRWRPPSGATGARRVGHGTRPTKPPLS